MYRTNKYIYTAPRRERERKEIVSFSKWIGMIGWLYRQRLFFGSASDEMVVPGSQIYNNSAAVYIQWLAYMMDMPDSVALYCTIQPEERGWYIYSDCAVRLIRSPRRQRVGFDGNLTTTIRRLRIIIICAVLLQREGCIFKWCAAATSLNEN